MDINIGNLKINKDEKLSIGTIDIPAIRGEKGDKGDRGEQGIQGVQGEKGEQGIQGEKGAKGDTGTSITSIRKILTINNVDTYRIALSDGTSFDFTVTNAESGDYSLLTNKPSINGITLDGNIATDELGIKLDNVISTFDVSLNQNTFVITFTAKNSSGTVLQTKTIDLPIESVVVNGSYDSTNKKINLKLQNGNIISFSVADLVNGLVNQNDFNSLNNTVTEMNEQITTLQSEIDNIKSQPTDYLPIGAVIEYSGTTEPTGYKFPNGQELSRTEYADLFEIIGTTWGEGDGSTTFNLPDWRGRVPVMKSDDGTFATLGAIMGEEKHKMTESELFPHTHKQNEHYHRMANGTSSSNSSAPYFNKDSGTNVNTLSSAGRYWYSNTTSATATNQNTGGGQPFNIIQPSTVTNFLIKVSNVLTTVEETSLKKAVAEIKSTIGDIESLLQEV